MEAQLNEEEKGRLRDHLETCQECRELLQSQKDISHLFRSSPSPIPQPGFTTRWKIRLEERERTQRLKVISFTLGIIFVSLILLLSSIGVQFSAIRNSLPQVLFHAMNNAVNWLLFIDRITKILEPIIRVGVKLIPPVWYYIISITLSAVLIAWLFTISESMIFIRRFTNENIS
jgi:hypothetical protein